MNPVSEKRAVKRTQHGLLTVILADVDCHISTVFDGGGVVAKGGSGYWPFIAGWEAKGEVRWGDGILLQLTDVGPLLEVKDSG